MSKNSLWGNLDIHVKYVKLQKKQTKNIKISPSLLHNGIFFLLLVKKTALIKSRFKYLKDYTKRGIINIKNIAYLFIHKLFKNLYFSPPSEWVGWGRGWMQIDSDMHQIWTLSRAGREGTLGCKLLWVLL